MSTRRSFIKQFALTAADTLLFSRIFSASEINQFDFLNTKELPRHILLRSGWQVENIGDIAHTPGALALIEKYIPNATITFWPWYDYLPDNELHMLQNRFAKMKLVQGKLNADGKASTKELQEAIVAADFFLHNSGPATIAWADAATFKRLTGKPFGVYGVSYGLYGTPELNTLNDAAFVYFRDSLSLQKAKQSGVHAPIMGFSPDVAFAIDVTDEESAKAFLAANKLHNGEFLCCIPKQRNTPVWLHTHKNRPFDQVKNARNEEMKEHDHLPLRAAITAVVRKTKLKILICHEDETGMLIGKEWLLDKLPEDVKPRLVWLNRHWLTNEAVSIYKRSAGLFGNEMHSPIMCIANGTPAIVCRWQEQSTKGIMWKDIGLNEWLFDFDNEEEIKRFVPAVLSMAADSKAAKAKALRAKKLVDSRFKETMKQVEIASRPVKA